MHIGIPAETTAAETRVAATPATVKQLISLGYDVLVESGAGRLASFSDTAYAEAGAMIADRATTWAADVVLKVNKPSTREIARLKAGAILVGLLSPAFDPELIEAITAAPNGPVTALAMDAVPRISRAQSMDVLSSMANIAGYRAVIEAAHEFGRFFTGQVTAAGKVPPAKVLVAGAGVAGLAAIGAAGSLGAIVRATDPRPEVADQVRSLGGEYVPVIVPEENDQGSSDGYAKATSGLYDAAAKQLYAEQTADVDIIITTALIPGRPAPKLITEADVASMKAGSVIVDMAAAQGGNVAGSVAGEKIMTSNGVTIIGYTDLPGRLPTQASQLFGTNLVNLMKLLTPGKDGRVVLDLADVVLRAITVVKAGGVLWPPPPVQVSAAPMPTGTAAPAAKSGAMAPKRLAPAVKWRLTGIGAAALLVMTSVAPAPLPQHFTVLALSIVVGFYVIGKVAHALHTPLMSVTNAISGIVVVGALLQHGIDDSAVRTLAFAAVLLASINIFGGFAVTRRMLAMFQKGA
ncbi:Re/Si-specific NAD(P)(+) transhydrogenase subunit alpha [Arthrobacter gyeryongensis]|uniref:proton-translocating NAD(P)(+) transhydrogenase n=1 Tax=Arthrobacter gyeryongensis TaxID=1650592 RepID=A0ABP9SLM3_9MICC